MYEEFYGLDGKPFSILPDPDFLFWARGHDLAYAMLEYGIMNQAGFTVITGEIGCGKTTLARQLLRNIGPDVNVGLLTNTVSGPGRLLEWVLLALNQPFENESYVKLYQRFRDFVVQENQTGRRTVLVIDEAQNLGPEALEELRMLSNINADNRQVLQLVLLGQPQLRDLLQQPSLAQFAQRVSSDYHLGSLSEKEVTGYIYHRLQVAGATKRIFSQEACSYLAQASHGVPRVINILCDTALVYGFSSKHKWISCKIVEQVIEDRRQHGVFANPTTRTSEPAPLVISKRAESS